MIKLNVIKVIKLTKFYKYMYDWIKFNHKSTGMTDMYVQFQEDKMTFLSQAMDVLCRDLQMKIAY